MYGYEFKKMSLILGHRRAYAHLTVLVRRPTAEDAEDAEATGDAIGS
jgi:hypothetical protein